ncbi:J domain-containing protein [Synechococcus elongatus]|uniref:J domain-containing protein n=1 Tax=Synechococcus elongatus TaxID=32046 RepID=UPI001EDE257A|nr:J domain-containing protein [Synechococcus elongatus]
MSASPSADSAMVTSPDYYARLRISSSASDRDIRQAYRELSKQYHPDTTTLPLPAALQEFQKLQEAYSVLSDPERRRLYDFQLEQHRWTTARAATLPNPSPRQPRVATVTSDRERTLSAGEIFALFLLSLTVVGCLVLTIGLGLLRGEQLLQTPSWFQVTTPAADVQAIALPDSEPAPIETPALLAPTSNDNPAAS